MKNVTSWKNFLVIYLIQTIQLLDFMSITPTGALYVRSGLIKSSTISYSLALYSISAIISSLVLARLKELQVKKALTLLLYIFSFSQLLPLILINPLSFTLAKCIGGFSGGVLGAISYSQLTNIDQGKNSDTWNGRIQTAQSLVIITGIPLCLFIVENLSPRYFYLILALISIILTFIINSSSFFSSNNKKTTQLSIQFIYKNQDIAISGFIIFFIAFLFISQLPNYLLNCKNLSTTNLSLAYSISGILTFLTASYIGLQGKKYSKITLLTTSCFLAGSLKSLFLFDINNTLLSLIFFPFYIVLSNARAIYQRGLILIKNKDDYVPLHLLNNIVIRLGIMFSGLTLGLIDFFSDSIEQVFITANLISVFLSAVISIYISRLRPVDR